VVQVCNKGHLSQAANFTAAGFTSDCTSLQTLLTFTAQHGGSGVLVHCGAGVSRSASLCIAYLMRRFAWNAARARKHCQSRRSLVNPNDGFWRSLCAFEQVLGITDRSALIMHH